MELGFAFSSEEHTPRELVRQAVAAEQAGFRFGLISDHYHPWIDRQGHGPFVWGVLGGHRWGNGRLHHRDRRHVSADPDPPGDHRPGGGDRSLPDARPLLPRRRHRREPQRAHPRRQVAAPDERLELLEEAVEVLRDALVRRSADAPRQALHRRERAASTTCPTSRFRSPSQLRNPRRPSSPAGSATRSSPFRTTPRSSRSTRARAAAVRLRADPRLLRRGRAGGAQARTRGLAECGHQGRRVTGAALPEHFEQLAQMVTEDDVAESVVCGPDPERYLEKIRSYGRPA